MNKNCFKKAIQKFHAKNRHLKSLPSYALKTDMNLEEIKKWCEVQEKITENKKRLDNNAKCHYKGVRIR